MIVHSLSTGNGMQLHSLCNDGVTRGGTDMTNEEDNMNRIVWLIGVPIVSLLVLVVVFLLGMRFKIPPVVDTVRRLNRAYTNPKQMRTAGQPGAYAAVLHHVGRKSGTQYRTPIGVAPYEDGFVVNLTYGPDTDWALNLMAAGSATLTYEGETITVDAPNIVPVDTISHAFSVSDRRAQKLFGIAECLVMHRVD
jgi:deazaflavin-dependent oxidoreductase (nitroreductase family)